MTQKMDHWCFDQLAYQSVANNQVDWAKMARQWIEMRETNEKHINLNQSRNSIENVSMHFDSDSNQNWCSNSSATSFYQNNSEIPQNMNFFITPPPPPLSQPSTNITMTMKTPEAKFQNEVTMATFVNMPKTITKSFSTRSSTATVTSNTSSYSIDASRRKQLPAWIREGLESMEREKIDREKIEHEKKTLMTANVQNNSIENYDVYDPDKYSPVEDFSNHEVDIDDNSNDRFSPNCDTSKKSIQDITDDQMILIRKKMTEILSHVFDTELKRICSAEFFKYRKMQENAPQQLKLSKEIRSFSASKEGLSNKQFDETIVHDEFMKQRSRKQIYNSKTEYNRHENNDNQRTQIHTKTFRSPSSSESNSGSSIKSHGTSNSINLKKKILKSRSHFRSRSESSSTSRSSSSTSRSRSSACFSSRSHSRSESHSRSYKKFHSKYYSRHHNNSKSYFKDLHASNRKRYSSKESESRTPPLPRRSKSRSRSKSRRTENRNKIRYSDNSYKRNDSRKWERFK